MHIFIFVSSLNFGGAEKQVVLDANMLSHNNKVTIGVFENGQLAEYLNPSIKIEVFKKDNYINTTLRIARYIKKNQIDIIHSHLFAPMVIATLSSFITKKPVIWHFHGHHFEVNKMTLNILSRSVYVKKLLFVCDALKDYFINNFSFPENKIQIIHNSTQFDITQEKRQNHKRFTIGFIGRLVSLKRVEYLIELAGYLNQHNFHNFEIQILGDGPIRKDLEALSENHAVSDQVKFLGFQTNLNHYYYQFDLFILPSREEALSLSLIDASRSGIPSIAFDVGGNKEIIINGKTGYIVYSKKELFEKALLLLKDEKLRHQMGINAENHSEIFSEHHHLKKLEQIYEQYV